jgi:hypothetical protein
MLKYLFIISKVKRQLRFYVIFFPLPILSLDLITTLIVLSLFLTCLVHLICHSHFQANMIKFFIF